MNNNDFNKFARANECECFKCLAAAENNLMRGIFELGYLLHLAKIMFFFTKYAKVPRRPRTCYRAGQRV